MQLRYDEDFLESAVLLRASGKQSGISPLLIQRYHRQRERLYSILDPEERNRAFFNLNADWFREWGLESLLQKHLEPFPIVAKQLKVLAFRKARSKNEEGAELYVNESGKNGVIAMRVEQFQLADSLERFLNHELMHLQDMVDPEFGYSRGLSAGFDPMHQRLIRERYRVLWDVVIDGRLANRKMPTVATEDMRREEFDRTYHFWSPAERTEMFTSLWTEINPNHERLLKLAADPRNVLEQHQPLPGAPCPLCGFPTFEWTDITTFKEEMRNAITRDFAQWQPEHGACKRCAEIYKAVSSAIQNKQPLFALS